MRLPAIVSAIRDRRSEDTSSRMTVPGAIKLSQQLRGCLPVLPQPGLWITNAYVLSVLFMWMIRACAGCMCASTWTTCLGPGILLGYFVRHGSLIFGNCSVSIRGRDFYLSTGNLAQWRLGGVWFWHIASICMWHGIR